jgi:hypothetical protein
MLLARLYLFSFAICLLRLGCVCLLAAGLPPCSLSSLPCRGFKLVASTLLCLCSLGLHLYLGRFPLNVMALHRAIVIE